MHVVRVRVRNFRPHSRHDSLITLIRAQQSGWNYTIKSREELRSVHSVTTYPYR